MRGTLTLTLKPYPPSPVYLHADSIRALTLVVNLTYPPSSVPALKNRASLNIFAIVVALDSVHSEMDTLLDDPLNRSFMSVTSDRSQPTISPKQSLEHIQDESQSATDS